MTDGVKALADGIESCVIPFVAKAFTPEQRSLIIAALRLASQREDVIEECAKVAEKFAENSSFVEGTFAAATVAKRIRSLAAQPRSNRVEVGAGRDSIQIEASSDTASANAKSGVAK